MVYLANVAPRRDCHNRRSRIETMSTNPFRSMTSSLLDRRWAALLIEFVLIIAGILAALAIDGWASERTERKSERAYLAALVADLHQFEEELNEQIAFEDDMVKTCVTAFNKANSANPAEHSLPLGALLWHLAVRRTLFLESAAYTELVSTGKFGIISDLERCYVTQIL